MFPIAERIAPSTSGLAFRAELSSTDLAALSSSSRTVSFSPAGLFSGSACAEQVLDQEFIDRLGPLPLAVDLGPGTSEQNGAEAQRDYGRLQ